MQPPQRILGQGLQTFEFGGAGDFANAGKPVAVLAGCAFEGDIPKPVTLQVKNLDLVIFLVCDEQFVDRAAALWTGDDLRVHREIETTLTQPWPPDLPDQLIIGVEHPNRMIDAVGDENFTIRADGDGIGHLDLPVTQHADQVAIGGAVGLDVVTAAVTHENAALAVDCNAQGLIQSFELELWLQRMVKNKYRAHPSIADEEIARL